jgi:hypothetical protein
MKKPTLALVLVPGVLACASLTSTSQGADVKVYQADLAERDAAAPPLPEGCRRLGASGPIEQQQEDREISDPYRTERSRTASLGGNVLYVQSYRFMNLMKIDCPVGDTSPGCMDRSQSWYRVTFESYACNAPALQALAEAPPPASPSVFRFELVKKTPKPESSAAPATPASPAAAVTPVPAPAPDAAALKAQVLALMQEGVGADVIRLYVRSHALAAPLTADEIIDWKRSGIAETIIEATFR